MAKTSRAALYLAALAVLVMVASVPRAEADHHDNDLYGNYRHPTCPANATGDPCGNAVYVKKGCKVQVQILKNEAAYTNAIWTCKKVHDKLKPDQFIGYANETGKEVQVNVRQPGELIFCINSVYPKLKVNDWFYSGCASRNFDGVVHAAVFQVDDYIPVGGGRRSLLGGHNDKHDDRHDRHDDDNDFCRRSLVVAFEDRRGNQPDRPQAPSQPKDFNDAVIKVSGCIKCFTSYCHDDGFQDCDGNKWNGYETDCDRDHGHCGQCNSPCKDSQYCDTGSCRDWSDQRP